MKSLRKFYKRILKEETKRLSVDSLDDQIDSLLLGYQGSSSMAIENNSLHSLLPLLMEAPGDEEEEDPFGDEEEQDPFGGGDGGLTGGEEDETEAAPPPGDEPPPEEVQGSEEIESEEPAKPNVPKIDLDIYSQKVVNLLDNHSNLLDIKSVIINRAMNVLRESYGEDVIEEFQDILNREFGVDLEADMDEIPDAPLGGNAGPSPA
jgi:hypothetical protein